MMFLSLCLAVFIDAVCGEAKRFHPLVGFGSWVKSIEARFYPVRGASSRHIFFVGIAAWCAAVLPWWLLLLLFYVAVPVMQPLCDVLIMYFVIARKSLIEHVRRVYLYLLAGDLLAARAAVAMIVSRDTQTLSPQKLRDATVESALENGADGIFAAIFWFVIGGAPAALLYRLVNTMDAMWGYRNLRYARFGTCAARVDDVMNFIPARLLALTYAALGNSKLALQCWAQQARACASPNAGVVMTAGAGALQLSVGGGAYYHGHYEPRPVMGAGRLAEDKDLLSVLTLLDKALIVWLLLIALGSLIYAAC